MYKKECVAMILAGGQGSRLGSLTKKIAKPAVPFGAKYRIIDFTLSNCSNSGINTVGVLTQYQPLELNTYIGNGHPWDLDVSNGGVYVLPPYMRAEKGEWYKGTANAIYQNMDFISRFDPEYVLILSGDHIYKMDYSKMLQYHIQKRADVTISTITVPIKEASRFGILTYNEEGQVLQFDEKPKHPKSDQASMGIYIFNWKVLRQELILDENNPSSSNDFGKDIIPNILKKGMRLYGYPFQGYWKDVGTISSLWEANMDLLGNDEGFNLEDPNWPIMARSSALPPHFIGKDGIIKQSLVTEGCEIEGSVDHSILFSGVKIGKGSKVIDSIIMNNTIIGENVYINKAIIGNDCVIENEATINEEGVETPDYVSTKICSNGISLISPCVKIHKRMKIGKHSMITTSIRPSKEGQHS